MLWKPLSGIDLLCRNFKNLVENVKTSYRSTLTDVERIDNENKAQFMKKSVKKIMLNVKGVKMTIF